MNKKESKRAKEKLLMSRLSSEGQTNRKKMIATRVKNTENRQREASKLAKARKTTNAE